jgi:hypothetical protein
MRVLAISPYFPPIANSEAFCGAKFVQGLIDAGIEARVIYHPTTKGGLDTSTSWESLDEISVPVANPPRRGFHSQAWLALRYQTTSWVGWTRAVVSKAKALHHERPFDLIISRSMPWYAHVTGFWVSRSLRLPWIANVNDPWDFTPFVAMKSHLREWKTDLNVRLWWQRVVSCADGITFPCQRLQNHCLSKSRRRAGTFVIPHIGSCSQVVENGGEFLIVHAGKLGLDEVTGRSARPLVAGVAGLFKKRPTARSLARLIFVGSEQPDTMQLAGELGILENLVSVGVVSYEESLRHIARASVCVLVEADFREGIFLPSKLCDYIVARKPILALSPELGTVNDLASEGGIRRVSPRDSTAVTEALVELFDAFLAKQLGVYAPPDALVQRFERRKVTKEFLSSVAHFALASRLARF